LLVDLFVGGILSLVGIFGLANKRARLRSLSHIMLPVDHDAPSLGVQAQNRKDRPWLLKLLTVGCGFLILAGSLILASTLRDGVGRF
jgi:hypothetical protein